MLAVRFVGVGRPAQIEDVSKPSPAPGQVLIRIGGAGVCHSLPREGAAACIATPLVTRDGRLSPGASSCSSTTTCVPRPPFPVP